MVPNGWTKIKLGDHVEFRNGVNADKDQYGEGVKFVNVMDVFNNDILTESKIIGRITLSDNSLKIILFIMEIYCLTELPRHLMK